MKKNKGVRLILIGLVSMVPLIALAQASPIGGIVTFGTIIGTITNSIIRTLVGLFATMAMAAFFFGIVQYIWGLREGKEDQITKGNRFMMWGLVALFVMFSVWGIITYVQKVIGVTDNTILIPDIKIQGGSSSGSPSPLGTTPTVFTCPAGTVNAGAKYYNQSDYGTACETATSNTTPPPVSPGNSTNGQPLGYCPDGTPYYSQSDIKFCGQATNSSGVNCSQYSTSADCTSNGCSWSNADGCSQ